VRRVWDLGGWNNKVSPRGAFKKEGSVGCANGAAQWLAKCARGFVRWRRSWVLRQISYMSVGNWLRGARTKLEWAVSTGSVVTELWWAAGYGRTQLDGSDGVWGYYGVYDVGVASVVVARREGCMGVC